MKISDLDRQFKYYALYERGMQPKSYKGICSTLMMFCEFTHTEELKNIDSHMIREFLYHGREARGWKSQTFRNHCQNFKSFFDWCRKNRFVDRDLLEGIEKPKRDKILPRCICTEDARKVLYHAMMYTWRYSLEKYRNIAILSTLMMAGLRLQELLDLEVSDVNLSSGFIMVREGKGRKDRAVAVHPKLLPMLAEYMQQKVKRGFLSLYFFTGAKSDKPMTQKDIRRICRKVGIAAGVKFTPHMLRHTFAREMIDNDFNLYKLKEMMGHSDVTTTQRYLAISTKGIKNSLNQIEIF